MSKPAFSVHAFGLYLLILGIVLTIAPNLLLSTFGIAETSEVWIRVVGILAFNIGIYYIYAARCEAKAFFQASVYTRALVLVSFTAFAALGFASPLLILFGAVDFTGAIWTQLALRAEKAGS
ncbi:hypothetical protein ACFJGW_00810 [Burkholderiaceae bacterium UC74_6]